MTENEAIDVILKDHSTFKNPMSKAYVMACKALEEIQQYRAIGTIEEFKALKEQNEPYKPKEYEDRYYACKCGNPLLHKWDEYPTKLMPKSRGLSYCLNCGQKLDWN